MAENSTPTTVITATSPKPRTPRMTELLASPFPLGRL